MQIINASNWLKWEIGEIEYYSPNSDLIQLIQKNPEFEFWHSYYANFACLIIDKNTNRIRAIRDHFGLEPFYYQYSSEHLIFASNLPDILKYLKSVKVNYFQMMNLLLNTIQISSLYSDETNYESIYRIEPGTITQFKNNQIIKTKFWHLDINAPEIRYSKSSDYLEHFNELINESVSYQLSNGQTIAAEFSGGLDSSTVVTALTKLGINPTLFMHIAPPESNVVDDMNYALEVIRTLNLNKIHHIDAKEFELIEIMQEISQCFAGSPNYLFTICANNIHRAVAKHGFNTLFSGFGGDEAASSHAPLRPYLAEQLSHKNYQIAWNELKEYYNQKGNIPPNRIKRFLQLIRFSQPKLFNLLNSFASIPEAVEHYWQKIPYFTPLKHTTSLRKYEYEFLQGRFSHHLRMRVEDSAIIAKKMGFSYKYPLLYPKLVEFCFRLPLEQKRHLGVNRLPIRKYLAQHLPPSVYNKHQKIGAIMPATMNKISTEYMNNKYHDLFKNIPYKAQLSWIFNKYSQYNSRRFDKEILLYCLGNFIDSQKHLKIFD